MSANTIKRKIYFYRIDIGQNQVGEDLPFDAETVMGALETKISAAPDEPYLRRSSGRDFIKCTVDRLTPRPRISLGKVRRENLPRQDRRGVVTDLNIPSDAGLLEEAHLVFFSNNIVGFEFNFYAPRITALRHYFSHFLEDEFFSDIGFHQLLNQDATRKLDELGELTLFRLRMDPALAEEIEDLDESLAGAFRAAQQAGESHEVEVVLRSKPRDRCAHLQAGLKALAKALSRRPAVYEGARKLEVKGRHAQTERSQKVNLLEDKLIVSKEIVQLDSRSRAVSRESAYQAIEEAEEQKREELLRARGITS